MDSGGTLRTCSSLPVFDRQSVLAEVCHWSRTGVSCFGRALKKLGLRPLENSPLEQYVDQDRWQALLRVEQLERETWQTTLAGLGS